MLKSFCYRWVGISWEYGRCNNIDQQFADARLSKIAQIALTLWLQEKIMYVKCEGDLFRNFYTI